MRSKPETFAAYADECDRKALGVTDGRLKGLFRDLAFQWRSLAYTARSLAADERERNHFYKVGVHISKPVGRNRDLT